MNTSDNYPVAIALSEQTLTILEQYQVPPTPINFSVIYHYLSNKHPEMTSYIDEHISWHGSLDAVFIESVFLTYFSNINQFEESLLLPFELALSSTIDKLERQVSNEVAITENFKKMDRVLANSANDHALQPLIKLINTTLVSSQHQRNQLTKELAKTYKEVSVLKTQLKTSQEQAIRDSLTGLYNRRGCDEKLKQLDDDLEHCSLAIDIDHFKKINDNFGHTVGDQVIKCVASTISQHLGVNDFAARYGGEEFMVVIANKTINEAKAVAEKIRVAISQLRLKHKKSNSYLPTISISIGIAQYQQTLGWKSVFEHADSALYRAKDAGRNCCVVL